MIGRQDGRLTPTSPAGRSLRRMLVACAAHWYESLLFVAPVGFIAGALKWSSWRADREERALAAEPAHGPA